MGAVGVAGGWELGEDEEGRVFIRLGIVLGVLVASLVGLQVLYTSASVMFATALCGRHSSPLNNGV